MFAAEKTFIESKIKAHLQSLEIEHAAIEFRQIPFSGEWGLAVPLFPLAAAEARTGKKINVPQRAQELAEGIKTYLGDDLGGFSHAEAVNGYLNLYFSTSTYAQRVIDTVLEQGAHYGCHPDRGETVMVEYSQPNTHKAFHVGHLRNVILGGSICRILECAGYKVIRANYLGDIGLHVIKWMWNYLKNHDGETPTEDHTHWMNQIYAEADRLFQDPENEAEVRALYARWNQRDPEILALWEKTRAWSLEGFDQIYHQLDEHFDRLYYESEVETAGVELVESLIASGLAQDERPEGPVIMDLDQILGTEDEYRVLVVLRSDSSSLYATKDLPLAIKKFEDYQLDKSIYVIDVRQSLYLKQIFKTLEIMGFEWADKLYHLAYELVIRETIEMFPLWYSSLGAIAKKNGNEHPKVTSMKSVLEHVERVLLRIEGPLKSRVRFIRRKKQEHVEEGVIRLMTMHGSKGLEFDTVYIIGADEKEDDNSVTSGPSERRVFFVAMTRARSILNITYSGKFPLFLAEAGLNFQEVITNPEMVEPRTCVPSETGADDLE